MRWVVTACASIACAAVLASASASATEVHVFKSSFGGPGSAAGLFGRPYGVAVNSATGDVYVVDNGHNRVEEFDAAGTTVVTEFNGAAAETGVVSSPTQIAVDNGSPPDPSSEDVYVIDSGHGVIDKFDASGTYLNQLNGCSPATKFEAGRAPPHAINGVAVDPNGTLWVSLREGPICSFTNELVNKEVKEITTVFGGADEGLAVDSEDNLYFNRGKGIVVKVDSSGKLLLNPFGGDENASGLVVDSNSDELYLDNAELADIEAFTLNGVPLEGNASHAPFPSFGSQQLTFSNEIAVNSSNGMVYATDQTSDKVFIFEALVLPTVVGLSPSEQRPTSVTLNGSVNPEGTGVISCQFEYASSTEYEEQKEKYSHSVPCSPAVVGSGTVPVLVSAHLSGLSAETSYHYRLVAQNSAPFAGRSSDQLFFTGPLLQGEFATNVSGTSATLDDPIDPNGADTHYYVEYGKTSSYGGYAPVPPPGADLGLAVGALRVEAHVQGLEAGVRYHYRFVVVQAGETFVEPDHSFLTQEITASSNLEDGRAWELVTPADKKGALIEPLENGGQVQAAGDGSGLAYMSWGPHVGEDPQGHVTYSQVLARHTAEGWRSADLTLPDALREDKEPAGAVGSFQFEYKLFSSDLGLAAVEPQEAGTQPLSPEASTRTLYIRHDSNGSFDPLVTSSNVPEGAKIEEEPPFGVNSSEWEMHLLAVTPDLAHVVFKTPMALTPEAPDEESLSNEHEGQVQWNLYEWNEGSLGLVNVLPDGTVAHGPAAAVPGVRLAGTVNAGGFARGGVQRVISTDGHMVAWAWGQPYTSLGLANYRGLYVRDVLTEKTMRIGGSGALYQTMNASGTKVFYLEGGDLYEFDTEDEVTSDLTAAHGAGETSAHLQELVSDVSEDGTYVYFVAQGVLAAGAQSGNDNLYLMHESEGTRSIRYITTLSSEDKPDWYAEAFEAPAVTGITSRVSSDGRFLTFMSNRSLTGYDNKDAVSGGPDEEVFLYSAATESLSCVSCNPTGERPSGVLDTRSAGLLVDRGGLWTGTKSTGKNPETDHWLAASVPGWDNLNESPATYQPRYLLNNGRVFFDSADALASRDTNGLEDVYEFELPGVGSCSEADPSFSMQDGGCVSLVSSGTASAESVFYDASESGDDVFFDTTSKLVDADFDKGFDIYDAHVCTSAVPCPEESVSPPPCSSGDSCKAPPASQPEIFGPAPSATFEGAGNVVEVPPVAAKHKTLTRGQRLVRALKTCRTRKGRRRSSCERQARIRYGAKRAKKSEGGKA